MPQLQANQGLAYHDELGRVRHNALMLMTRMLCGCHLCCCVRSNCCQAPPSTAAGCMVDCILKASLASAHHIGERALRHLLQSITPAVLQASQPYVILPQPSHEPLPSGHSSSSPVFWLKLLYWLSLSLVMFWHSWGGALSKPVLRVSILTCAATGTLGFCPGPLQLWDCKQGGANVAMVSDFGGFCSF